MKHIAAFSIAVSLAITPLQAQETAEEGAGPKVERFNDATRDLLEYFLGQIGPELEEMAAVLGPQLLDLMDKIGDLSLYHAPEVLPNGDVILRRKIPLEPEVDGEVEL